MSLSKFWTYLTTTPAPPKPACIHHLHKGFERVPNQPNCALYKEYWMRGCWKCCNCKEIVLRNRRPDQSNKEFFADLPKGNWEFYLGESDQPEMGRYNNYGNDYPIGEPLTPEVYDAL